jgi:hypothetical protein
VPSSLSTYYTLYSFTITNCSEDSGDRVFVHTVCVEEEGGRYANIHEVELLVCEVEWKFYNIFAASVLEILYSYTSN